MPKKVEKHSKRKCPYLHVKNCKGCGRSCSCYKKEPEMPTEKKTLKLIDDIKDEIDQLHLIKNEKRRKAAARELIGYIELHHNLPSTQP